MPDRPAEPGPARPRPRGSFRPVPPRPPMRSCASYQRGEGQPGIAYGIVAGGSLAHEGGVGQRWVGGPPPDAGTVFRIASMTKSFTASAVLALRDSGRAPAGRSGHGFRPGTARPARGDGRLTGHLAAASAHDDRGLPDR